MPKIYFKKRVKRPKSRNETGISFSSKVVPKEGIAAIITGIVSIILFLILSVYSTLKRGEASLFIGVIGMAAFILALAGFIVSLRAMKKDNVFLKIPIYGVAINTFAVILYLILYFYGMILMML